ncbi:MAG TPA: glycosyltransferase family 9 protein, partial [Noviherbaspirillum sp.]
LFSAEENFFQLPAILSLCDLIISVETAVMHLANAVHVPVIALMRQKNPEWAPIDTQNSTVITVPKADDWVEAITVEQVMAVLGEHAVTHRLLGTCTE